MKVVHLATSRFGGAGRAAERLHLALIEYKINSVLITLDHPNKCDNSLEIYSWYSYHSSRKSKKIFRIRQKLKNIFRNEKQNSVKGKLNLELEELQKAVICEIASSPFSDIDIWNHPLVKNATIIQLHWISRMVDYQKFFQNCKKPVLFTFHDMQPILGCFHYMEDQIINFNLAYNLNKKFIDIKTKAIASFNFPISLVSPSKWLANEVMSSYVFKKFMCNVIPYTIDDKIFNIKNKQIVRKTLGLPCDGIILLFVAENIFNYRKGFDLLLDALGKLNEKLPFTFLALGNYKDIFITCFPVLTPGYISDDSKLSLYFSAADVFILPSREDNLPNTMLESLCCGTPVIAFPTGGMKEIIQSGVNGLLAEKVDANSLANAINDWYENRDKYKQECISREAQKLFNASTIVNAYKKEYTNLIFRS
jgi:glycosyltransferase involved in cell wall biosynthesis